MIEHINVNGKSLKHAMTLLLFTRPTINSLTINFVVHSFHFYSSVVYFRTKYTLWFKLLYYFIMQRNKIQWYVDISRITSVSELPLEPMTFLAFASKTLALLSMAAINSTQIHLLLILLPVNKCVQSQRQCYRAVDENNLHAKNKHYDMSVFNNMYPLTLLEINKTTKFTGYIHKLKKFTVAVSSS